MNAAMSTTTHLATRATVGTPATRPADATITARRNSPTIMPRMTITLPAMSVGRNASICPNIALMLSRPRAALASRITTSITSQKRRRPAACTGSSREPVRLTNSSRPCSLATRLKSSRDSVASVQRRSWRATR